MRKRSLLLALSLAITSTGFLVAPAQAATIKNGVNCSKANATTKVGGKTYRCAKNPYVKPTRLTWTLSGCITANRLYKEAKSEYANWESLAKVAGAEGEKTLKDLQTSIDSLEITMKDQVCKRGA